jgi:hypothetical protein
MLAGHFWSNIRDIQYFLAIHEGEKSRRMTETPPGCAAMRCLWSLCVQCRDPMKLVTLQNGVSVPNKIGKLVALHSECFRAWLNAQVKNEPKPNFQATN